MGEILIHKIRAVTVLISVAIVAGAAGLTSAAASTPAWSTCSTYPNSSNGQLSICFSNDSQARFDSMSFRFWKNGFLEQNGCSLHPIDTPCVKNFLSTPGHSISALLVAPACRKTLNESNFCFEGVGLRKGNDEISLTPSRDWLSDPQNFNPSDRRAIPELNISNLGSASIWRPAGWIHGEPEYLASGNLTADIKIDGSSSGLVVRYSSPRLAIDKIFPWDGYGIGNTGERSTQFANFDDDESLSAKIRLPKALTGWFSTGVEKPVIGVDSLQSPDYSLVSLEGKPGVIDSIAARVTTGTEAYKAILGNYPYFEGGKLTLFPRWGYNVEALRELAGDKASFQNTRWIFTLNQSSLPCSDKAQIAGVVSSNALFQASTLPTYSDGVFQFEVGNPHFDAAGNVKLGHYSLQLNKAVASCIYGLSSGFYRVDISITDGAETNIKTQIVKADGEYFKASVDGFEFSNKSFQIRMLPFSQKSLNASAGFIVKSAQLSQSSRLALLRWVESNQNLKTATCKSSYSNSKDLKLAKARAKSLCAFLAERIPGLETSVSANRLNKVPNAIQTQVQGSF